MNANEQMIDKLFLQMDNWRHLPSYQFERRVEIFFSLYLPEVIKTELDFEVKEPMIPEFPVKLNLINKNIERPNDSIKMTILQ